MFNPKYQSSNNCYAIKDAFEAKFSYKLYIVEISDCTQLYAKEMRMNDCDLYNDASNTESYGLTNLNRDEKSFIEGFISALATYA